VTEGEEVDKAAAGGLDDDDVWGDVDDVSNTYQLFIFHLSGHHKYINQKIIFMNIAHGRGRWYDR
jgi:hypothetical protein